jgi:murein peptide amidase A
MASYKQSMQNSFIFGHSSLNIPIPAFKFGKEGPKVLILGGVHGDESEGVALAWGLYEYFLKNGFNFKLNLTLVPQFNMDGVIRCTRGNGRGIDLNRNLPTKDWSPEVKTPRYHPGPSANSESENQALCKFLESEKPEFLLSLHSWNPVLNINGDCLKQAEAMAKVTGYKIDSDIGYPTPGCLGTYAGLERGIPTLTYEIERGLALDKVIELHIPSALAALKATEK